jgi:hypothetical protein
LRLDDGPATDMTGSSGFGVDIRRRSRGSDKGSKMMAWIRTLCQLLVVVIDMGSGEFVDNSRTMLSIHLSPLASDLPREEEGDACKARSRTCGRGGRD